LSLQERSGQHFDPTRDAEDSDPDRSMHRVTQNDSMPRGDSRQSPSMDV
jgi:hypothetical protein